MDAADQEILNVWDQFTIFTLTSEKKTKNGKPLGQVVQKEASPDPYYGYVFLFVLLPKFLLSVSLFLYMKYVLPTDMSSPYLLCVLGMGEFCLQDVISYNYFYYLGI